MDIKLPVPITDAKKCKVSQLYINYITKKLLHKWFTFS